MRKLWLHGLGLALLVMLATPARAQSDTEKLYKAKCASCHAADGSGDTPAGKKMGVRDFRSPEVVKETDAQLIEITSKGKNKMPAYEGKMSKEAVAKLVAYVRELGKKR